MKKLTAIVLGLGSRGKIYSSTMNAMPEKYQVVGIAEPQLERREYIKKICNVPDDMCFGCWQDIFAKGKIADLAVITTMDKEHFEPAMKALELGYDVLLEKPIAPTNAECRKIYECAKKHGRKVIVCTVLRYTPLFKTIKNIIDSGEIGNVVSINHEECVGTIHYSHSFVRGNWGNCDRSSFMLLQKSCHDIDIIQWLIGKKCKQVQSFGALTYYKRENAPEGSPEYCIDGCPHGDTCHYNAVKLYLGEDATHWFRSTSTKKPDPTDEDVTKALKETQYGKCVFKCDNNVVDHQTCNMLFEDNVTATFTMSSFTKGERHIHIYGTKGELKASTDGNTPIYKFTFDDQREETIDILAGNDITSGHGGGDFGIINDLYDYLTDNYKGKSVPDIEESYMNHETVFALEESRLTGKLIDIEDFRKNN